MPHVSYHGGKPIHERSDRELVWMFIVFPILLGVGIIAMIVVSLLRFRDSFTVKDGLSAAWGILLAAALMIGLPAAAQQEWQRRKRFGAKSTSPPPERPASTDQFLP
jgi:hypothetical protein